MSIAKIRQIKLMYMSIWTVLLIAFLLLIYVGYILFWPFKPVTLNSPITVSPRTVKEGDEIKITMSFDKHMKISPTIEYFLVNGEAVIKMPEHFSLIVAEEGMTVQLTPHSAASEGLAAVSTSPWEIWVKELRMVPVITNLTFLLTESEKDMKIIRSSGINLRKFKFLLTEW